MYRLFSATTTLVDVAENEAEWDGYLDCPHYHCQDGIGVQLKESSEELGERGRRVNSPVWVQKLVAVHRSQ